MRSLPSVTLPPKAALGLATAVLFGCGGGTPTGGRPPHVELQIQAGEEQIIDMRSGQRVAFHDMMASLRETRIVYLGERHDRADDHAIQYAILRDLMEGGGKVGIALEMFQHPYQGPLDEWSAGRIDERELLRETEYEDRWGFDFDFYRPLLDLGKEHGTPLFAINAAKETTRAIAHGGLQALDPLQLSELPELEMNDREHFRLIESSISKNATMAPAAMRNYYAAQVVWDETMAFHVARIVNGRGAPDCLVVLAGHLRIQGGHGIPLRAARRGARPWQSVLPVDPDSDLARWSGPASERPADFLWIIPPPPP